MPYWMALHGSKCLSATGFGEMPPKPTLWPLDDHTRGKHMVLREYMDAWLPIILSKFNKAMFVDAFAGPGEYENGELGSPVIALNALAEHSSQRMMTGQIDYVFIEERSDRFEYLEKIIDHQRARGSVPDICQITMLNDTFAHVLPTLLKEISSERMPTFVMIDPFGVSGIGMKHIRHLMAYPSVEVYVSFMYEFINRFKEEDTFGIPLDDLFDCQDWRQGIDMSESRARKKFFYELYRSQLKLAGARYVLDFELYERNQLKYALFFGTKSDQGCDKMKRAMWKVAPLGGYTFRSDNLGQLSFASKVVDFSELERALIAEFGMNQPTTIEAIEEFMCSDRILFHSGHLKGCLADMERADALIVDQSPRKRRAGFPPGTRLHFVEPPSPLTTQGLLMPD